MSSTSMSAGFSQPPASTLTKALPARSALILHRGSHRTLGMRGCASVRAARVYVCAPVCLWGARVSARAGVWRGRALRPGGGAGLRCESGSWTCDAGCCEGQGAEPQCRSGWLAEAASPSSSRGGRPWGANPGGCLMSPPQRGLHRENARAPASVPFCLSVPLSSQVRE